MGKLRYSYGNNDEQEQRSNYQILMYAKDCHEALDGMRRKAVYNRKMLQGIQWTREELEAIEEQGQRPITHNIISQIMANLNGQYLAGKGNPVAVARKRECAKESKMMSLAIENVIEVNGDSQQDNKNFTRLATSGLICSRIDYGYISEKDTYDVITQNINPHTLFFTPLIDDGTNEAIDIIGTICEDSIDGLIINFAKDEDDAGFIKELYHYDKDSTQDTYIRRYSMLNEQSSERIDNMDFLYTSDYDKCRYYEIWTKERRKVMRYHDYATGDTGTTPMTYKEIEQINQERIQQCIENGINPDDAKLIQAQSRYEFVWFYRFMTPDGYILKQGESPFEHQSHPYILSFFDVMDGAIHPVISNITELQREINHLYMQADFMNGNGAKGVLFYDKKIFAESGISKEDVQQGWSAFNTAFGISLPAGYSLNQLVQQFYTRGDISPILNLYSNNVTMAQQIIGVNQAIQGQAPTSGTPASRYAQETSNAQLNSKPFLECMADFRIRKYKKVLKLIQQYYDEDKFIEVAGKENIDYNPQIRDIDFDMSITQEITTSNYSITEDDKLYQMVLQGMLPIDIYFELSHAGFAKQALEALKQRQQQAQEQQQEAMMLQQGGQMPQQEGVPQEMSAQPQLSEEQIAQLMDMIQQQQEPEQEIRQEEMEDYGDDDDERNRALLQQLLNR